MTIGLPPGPSRALWPTMAAVLAAALLLAACGSSDDQDTGDQSGGVQLSDIWTRPTAPGAESTAFYLTIQNGAEDEDRLVGAESDRCTMTEIHFSVMEDGVMSMSPAEADQLRIEPAGSLSLEPGGLHIMCMGLVEPVVDGQEVELTVQFAQAGSIPAVAVVENR